MTIKPIEINPNEIVWDEEPLDTQSNQEPVFEEVSDVAGIRWDDPTESEAMQYRHEDAVAGKQLIKDVSANAPVAQAVPDWSNVANQFNAGDVYADFVNTPEQQARIDRAKSEEEEGASLVESAWNIAKGVSNSLDAYAKETTNMGSPYSGGLISQAAAQQQLIQPQEREWYNSWVTKEAKRIGSNISANPKYLEMSQDEIEESIKRDHGIDQIMFLAGGAINPAKLTQMAITGAGIEIAGDYAKSKTKTNDEYGVGDALWSGAKGAFWSTLPDAAVKTVGAIGRGAGDVIEHAADTQRSVDDIAAYTGVSPNLRTSTYADSGISREAQFGSQTKAEGEELSNVYRNLQTQVDVGDYGDVLSKLSGKETPESISLGLKNVSDADKVLKQVVTGLKQGGTKRVEALIQSVGDVERPQAVNALMQKKLADIETKALNERTGQLDLAKVVDDFGDVITLSKLLPKDAQDAFKGFQRVAKLSKSSEAGEYVSLAGAKTAYDFARAIMNNFKTFVRDTSFGAALNVGAKVVSTVNYPVMKALVAIGKSRGKKELDTAYNELRNGLEGDITSAFGRKTAVSGNFERTTDTYSPEYVAGDVEQAFNQSNRQSVDNVQRPEPTLARTQADINAAQAATRPDFSQGQFGSRVDSESTAYNPFEEALRSVEGVDPTQAALDTLRGRTQQPVESSNFDAVPQATDAFTDALAKVNKQRQEGSTGFGSFGSREFDTTQPPTGIYRQVGTPATTAARTAQGRYSEALEELGINDMPNTVAMVDNIIDTGGANAIRKSSKELGDVLDSLSWQNKLTDGLGTLGAIPLSKARTAKGTKVLTANHHADLAGLTDGLLLSRTGDALVTLDRMISHNLIDETDLGRARASELNKYREAVIKQAKAEALDVDSVVGNDAASNSLNSMITSANELSTTFNLLRKAGLVGKKNQVLSEAKYYQLVLQPVVLQELTKGISKLSPPKGTVFKRNIGMDGFQGLYRRATNDITHKVSINDMEELLSANKAIQKFSGTGNLYNGLLEVIKKHGDEPKVIHSMLGQFMSEVRKGDAWVIKQLSAVGKGDATVRSLTMREGYTKTPEPNTRTPQDVTTGRRRIGEPKASNLRQNQADKARANTGASNAGINLNDQPTHTREAVNRNRANQEEQDKIKVHQYSVDNEMANGKPRDRDAAERIYRTFQLNPDYLTLEQATAMVNFPSLPIDKRVEIAEIFDIEYLLKDVDVFNDDIVL